MLHLSERQKINRYLKDIVLGKLKNIIQETTGIYSCYLTTFSLELTKRASQVLQIL